MTDNNTPFAHRPPTPGDPPPSPPGQIPPGPVQDPPPIRGRFDADPERAVEALLSFAFGRR